MNAKRGILAAVFVALLIAGSAVLVTGRSPEDLAIDWGRCAKSGETDVLPEVQCGELSVPLDYEKPDGARITIAVARLPATGQKTGSLLTNPGGPGEEGVNFLMDLADYVPTSVRDRFDVVGFDPRGIGRSLPALDCNTDAEDDETRADVDVDYSPAGVAETEQETEDYVQRCADKNGAELLANVGTESVARDMDLLRAALGDDKLTYIGFSYGTQLGAQYAELFPDRVRAMVLDGAVDPAADPMQALLDQAEAFQKAFEDYAADCANDPDCPLGTDPTKAVDNLHGLINTLVERPAQTEDARGLSYTDALTGVYDALYASASWDQLTDGLAALRDGKPADDLLELADSYNGRDSDGHYANTNDAYNVITCADSLFPTDTAAWVEFDKKYRQVSPFDVYGEFTGHAPRPPCALWPFRTEAAPHAVSAPGLPRTLVISTTGDPATPYIDGVRLAEQMHAALLTVEGTQHTAAFWDIPCVDDIVSDYLVDLTLPPPGKRCATGS